MNATATAPRTRRAYTSNEIVNPVRRGQVVTIPKGTVIHTTQPGTGHKVAGRTYQVTVQMISPGWVDTLNDNRKGRGFVVLPTITWAGAGSYWFDAQVTPEFAKANGIDLPTLPDYDDFDLECLDTVPAFGPGYDNTWV